MNFLFSFLKPYEPFIWLAIAVAMVALGVHGIHRLEHVGAEQVQAADARAAAAQAIHTEEVERRAYQLVAQRDSQLHAALVAPAPDNALAVRVCKSAAPAKHVVSANGSASAGSHPAPSDVPGQVASDDSGRDIGPDTERLLAEADAEIAYWQGYYHDCKELGICR